jgi:endo-1,3-1,4-beta-glycanase ExoK
MTVKIANLACLAAGALVLTAALPRPAATEEQTPKSAPSFVEHFDRLDRKKWFVSDGWRNGDYIGCTWSKNAIRIKDGLLSLQLRPKGEKSSEFICGEIQTNKAYGYGFYEVRMKSAAGSGLNSAFFTFIGPVHKQPHDEIDFELLGKPAPQRVQMNYYVNGKGGNENFGSLTFDPTTDFHTYAFEWTATGIRWFVDGKEVHAVGADRPLPSHSSKIYINLWNGTSKLNNWLGRFDPDEGGKEFQVDWVAFTAPGDSCQFPESIVCTLKR